MNTINIIQNKDVYELKFAYDRRAIDLVKQVPGRKWIPDRKVWTIPTQQLGLLLNTFKDTPYENVLNLVSDEQLNINSAITSTKSIPTVDLSDVTFYCKSGSALYEHQKDFLRYAIDRQNRLSRSGFILADEQGMGKTVDVINLAMYNKERYGYKHCLILCCINSSKYNWYNDIIDHTQGKEVGYILGTRKKRDGSEKSGTSKHKLADLKLRKMYGDATGQDLPYFLILNIEGLRHRDNRSYPITEELIHMIDNDELQMIAIDEIHKNASPTSLQGKQLLRIKKQSKNPVMWIPMTGTPIVNKPTDVFLPLKLIDGHSFSSYYMWCADFCVYGGFGGHQIIGYKNIPRLKMLLQNNMLRRLKQDVLDLPPKIHYTEYVDNTTYQSKLYSKIAGDIIDRKEQILASLNPLTELLRLRQVNGSPELVDKTLVVDSKYPVKNAKMIRLLELLEEIHERGEKVVIFSNWVDPLRTLYKFIATKYGVVAFTGSMTAEAREISKQKFQTDPSITILLGTIGSAGTSHTFTAANNIIFYDEPWTPAAKAQGEDRCHRIGTNRPVNIYTLITRNTVDQRVNDILYRKEAISNFIIDDSLDIRKNPEILDMLLFDSKRRN